MMLEKTRSRPKQRRPRRMVDKKHLGLVAEQPSVVSGQRPCVVHHLRTSMSTACAGRKSGDDETVSLTHAEHVDLHNSPDGEDGWWKRMGVDGDAEAARLWASSRGSVMP